MSDLMSKLKTMCGELGVDITLDPDVLAKAQKAHTSGQVKKLLALCDPNTQRIRKGEILAQCELNSDPDVVQAHTVSDITRTIHQARTLEQMGEQVVAEYTRAQGVLKGAKQTPKTDTSDTSTKVVKGKAKSRKRTKKTTSTDTSVQ